MCKLTAEESGTTSVGEMPSKLAPVKSNVFLFPESENRTAKEQSVIDSTTARDVTQCTSGDRTIEWHASDVLVLCQFFNISSPTSDDIFFLLFLRDRGYKTSLFVAEKLKWKCEKAVTALKGVIEGCGVTHSRFASRASAEPVPYQLGRHVSGS